MKTYNYTVVNRRKVVETEDGCATVPISCNNALEELNNLGQRGYKVVATTENYFYLMQERAEE